MAIPIAKVDFQGAPPTVRVDVGFLGLASYTIAVVPPDMDITKAVSFVTATTPAQVAAVHDLGPVWSPQLEDSFIVVFGGIGATVNPPQFSVDAVLSQNGVDTPMITTLSAGSSAATFVSSVELQK